MELDFVEGHIEILEEYLLDEQIGLVEGLQGQYQKEEPSHVASKTHQNLLGISYLDFGCLIWKPMVKKAIVRLNTEKQRTQLWSQLGMNKLTFSG